VFFVEEPVFGNGSMRLDVREAEGGVQVVVPHVPEGLRSEIAITAIMKEMIRRLFSDHGIYEYVFWYYTPMALTFTNHFTPIASVYDCMDELSAFKGAHSRLPELEKQLFERVDLVFTGGQSLYEAKRNAHANIHPCPSSIDAAHFGQARLPTADRPDQVEIPHPRLGFFGVIDERLDIELLQAIAIERPDWQFVMIGPVVKIHSKSLPKYPNIHYLGPKKYEELPAYLANWDIALLLFARNESTHFISPTKTPEYLAAGKHVISTSVRDVVRPYGDLQLVKIADTPEDFIRAAEDIFAKANDNSEWIARVDDFLKDISWDKTWHQMSDLIESAVAARRNAKAASVSLASVGQQVAAAV
jgi:UDP-galactopyranose mutase